VARCGQAGAEEAALPPAQVRSCLTWDRSTQLELWLREKRICTYDFAFQSLILSLS